MSLTIVDFCIQYSLYIGYITFIAGTVGNVLNILVFTQLKLFRDNRAAFYLTVESISNLLFQFISISVTILISIYGDDATGRNLIWCRFRFFSTQTVTLMTCYTICIVACDQFFSTNYRFRELCTIRLARYLLFTSACLWFIHSIIFCIFLEIQPTVGCIILNSIWLRYSSYFFYPILIGFLPIIISSLFNFLAFRNVRRIIRRQLPIARRRLDQQMTAMVLTRVVIFVCFLLPYIIYRIYAINVPVAQNKSLEYSIRQVIQTLFVSLSSVNFTITFYIFILISPRYRRQVKFVLVKRYWRTLKSYCCGRGNQITPEIINTIDSNIELE